MGKKKTKKVILSALILCVCIALVGLLVKQAMWREKSTNQRLDIIFNNTLDHKKVFDMMVNVESGDGSFSYIRSAGQMKDDTPFAIASITKMFTTAVIFNLVDSGQLSFNDKLDQFFDPNLIAGLHVYKESDRTGNITIEQLISQTSGLPDYYTEKGHNGTSFEAEILKKDTSIDFEQILSRSKQLEAHFINGDEGKAYYSDLNFELLGRIAEQVTGEPLEDLYKKYIIKPLNLKSTYLSKPDSLFVPIHIGKEPVHRPMAISSQGASGGMISNSTDLMKFLKAFFHGELFSPANITNVNWNKIQYFPLQYGKGMMRVKMSRLMSPFFPAPEILGHSGSSGSFAFYCPSRDLFIVGTMNQTEKNPFQLIYQMLDSVD
ncbi:serine hydrolase domain-containing protein [Paenibacillus lutimineralis]|uniref:Class A beta-lactamase-related serine hydrolase n=1 Tax=Paenibacillus lutimineralis TaxID=2707005 RepID=A0A3S9V5I3_9BACL|nr:serine hydrolase domain-containing protein [Paenibacillus lutimineralis]AZS17806.1 class A beta-lactamase-related serine hydrolase [Paenibacillus lutimineralis]